jgi:hypothetical protein
MLDPKADAKLLELEEFAVAHGKLEWAAALKVLRASAKSTLAPPVGYTPPTVVTNTTAPVAVSFESRPLRTQVEMLNSEISAVSSSLTTASALEKDTKALKLQKKALKALDSTSKALAELLA